MRASSRSRSVDYCVEVSIRNNSTDFEEQCEYTSPDMDLHARREQRQDTVMTAIVMSHTLS